MTDTVRQKWDKHDKNSECMDSGMPEWGTTDMRKELYIIEVSKRFSQGKINILDKKRLLYQRPRTTLYVLNPNTEYPIPVYTPLPLCYKPAPAKPDDIIYGGIFQYDKYGNTGIYANHADEEEFWNKRRHINLCVSNKIKPRKSRETIRPGYKKNFTSIVTKTVTDVTRLQFLSERRL